MYSGLNPTKLKQFGVEHKHTSFGSNQLIPLLNPYKLALSIAAAVVRNVMMYVCLRLTYTE